MNHPVIHEKCYCGEWREGKDTTRGSVVYNAFKLSTMMNEAAHAHQGLDIIHIKGSMQKKY